MNDPTIAYMELVHKMVEGLRDDLRHVQAEMKEYREQLAKKPSFQDLEGFTVRLSKDIESLSKRMEIIIGEPESLANIAKKTDSNSGKIAMILAIAMGAAGFLGWLIPLLMR